MAMTRGELERLVGNFIVRINREFPETKLYFTRVSSQRFLIGNDAGTLIYRTGPKPLWDYLCGYWQAKRDSNGEKK